MAEDLKLFEGKKIRHIYNEEKEVYYFSVVDVVAILIEKDYQSARKYWNKLAQRLRDEGSEQTVTNCHQLKLKSSDGKKYKTDVADIKTMFRIIQSIPSKKAEPIKQWLAKVGQERIQELADPSTALDRARDIWQKQGRSEKWIQQRMSGQDILFPKKRNQSVGHFLNKNIIYVCNIIADLCGVNYRKLHKQLQARFV